MILYINILLALLAIFFSKSKLLAKVIFIHMWVLWGWNSWNGDYEAYSYMYLENSAFSGKILDYESGYKLINYIFSSIGFSFQFFQITIAFFVLYIIYKISSSLVRHIALFSAAYMLIFFMEYVFIRNYIAHAIILYGVYLLFNSTDPRRKFKCFLMFVIATSIHMSSIVAFIFLLADRKGRIINLFYFLPVVLICLFISFLIFNSPIASFLGEQILLRVEGYQTEGGVSNIFLGQIFVVLLILYYYFSILKTGNLTDNEKKIYSIIVNVNILSLLYLSIYYYIPYFSRAIRMLLTLDLIFLIATFKYQSINFKLKMQSRNLVFILIMAVVGLLFSKSTLYLTYTPLMKNNLIWGDEGYREVLRD
jgi:hypothetical protein